MKDEVKNLPSDTQQATQVKLPVLSDVELQMSHFLHISYHSSFVLTNLSGTYLTETEARLIFLRAFKELAERYPSDLPIKTFLLHGQPFTLGAYLQRDNKRNYLIPTFRGGAVSHIRCEFTSSIERTCHIESPLKPRKYRAAKEIAA